MISISTLQLACLSSRCSSAPLSSLEPCQHAATSLEKIIVRRRSGGVERWRHGRVTTRMQAARSSDRGSSTSNEPGKGFGAPSLQTEGAPSVSSKVGDSKEQKRERNPGDAEFEERLAAIRRNAEEKKKADEVRRYNAIDYDNPEKDTSEVATFFTKDLGSKIGIGIAATVFAAIFAFGDIIPPVDPQSFSSDSSRSPSTFSSQLLTLTSEQKESYQAQVKEFEATLETSPEDLTALEGASVLYVELGDLPKADELLKRLEKVSPGDIEVLRLHAEVQYTLGNYPGSTKTYRRALEASGDAVSVELLQGLTESLVAESKPKEAVDELLEVRRRTSASLAEETSGEGASVDPVQVDLLLGKAYSAWGKPGDAAAVYDGLMATRPEDFRGYLAKAMLLKGQGKEGDAKRMFLQAKFLAPEVAKGLVDKLANS